MTKSPILEPIEFKSWLRTQFDKWSKENETVEKNYLVLNKIQWKYRKEAQKQFPNAIIVKDCKVPSPIVSDKLNVKIR